MFTDEAELIVKAGKGGDGHISFHKEKYVPFGGPDGGDGGRGGDVILKVKKSMRTLTHIKSKKIFKAQPGDNGGKKNCTGKDGSPCIIEVPLGTLVRDNETQEILYDLSQENSEAVVAKGGRGGKGNLHFTSSTNQAPKFAQDGKPGESFHFFLELKLIADIGLVGFPNAGKSTLLSRLSKAHPKIANYPFTTLSPNLGVCYVSEFESFIIADIPGIIEGAHKGVGLGIQFLKHIERTRGLLFMIDSFETDPYKQFELLIEELKEYHLDMLNKPFFIALNKKDLYQEDELNLIYEDFSENFKKSSHYISDEETPVHFISAVSGEGLDSLKFKLHELIIKAEKEDHQYSSLN